MKLSICIPTYNRPELLDNCLNSIYISKKNQSKFKFEVCISDNSINSTSKNISKKYSSKFNINYKKNKNNIGYIKNYLKVLKMAKGEFAWVIGDDEILKPNCLKILSNHFNQNKNIDFIFTNCNFLENSFFDKFPKPFNSKNLPKKMETISKLKRNKVTNFFELIDYNVSWDFLLGIFQCIFKKDSFLKHLKIIDKKKLYKPYQWSTFENTAFYTEVYAAAFKNSKVLIQSKPLIVSTYGHKNWKDLWDFIKIVRIPELLDMYRKRGMKYKDYIKMKNFALKDFFFCFKNIFLKGRIAGLQYVDFKKHILSNILFPSIYLNFFRRIFNKVAGVKQL